MVAFEGPAQLAHQSSGRAASIKSSSQRDFEEGVISHDISANFQEFHHIQCSKSRCGHHLFSLQRGRIQDMVEAHGHYLVHETFVAYDEVSECEAILASASEPWA